MEEQNIDKLDFVFISGDAYVDHPSFGVAIISRVLEAGGYKVGIIPQPDWKNKKSFEKLGEPSVITSYSIHYTKLYEYFVRKK